MPFAVKKDRIRSALCLLPALVWLMPLLLFATGSELFMLATATLVHEGGHLLAFALLGEPMPRPAAVPAGLTLTPRRPLSYPREAAVALAGPFFNLAVAIPLLALGGGTGASVAGTVQLLCALINLLPLRGGDGGRTVSALLHLLLAPPLAVRMADALSLLTLILLLFALMYLLLSPGGEGVILLLICLFQRAVLQAATRP